MAPNTGRASTRRRAPPPPPPPPPPPAAADDDDLDFSVFLDAPPPVPVPAAATAPFAPSFQTPSFPPSRAPAAFVPAPVPAPTTFAAPQQPPYPSYHTLEQIRPSRTPFAGLQTVFRVATPSARNLYQPSQQLQPPVSTHPGLEGGINGNGGKKSSNNKKNNKTNNNSSSSNANNDDDDDNDDDGDDDDNEEEDDDDEDGDDDNAGDRNPLAQLSGSPYFPDPAAAAAAAALNHPTAAPDDAGANPWIALANAVFTDPSVGIESVRSAAATSGFGVVKSRSARRHQTVAQRETGELGEVYRIDLECTSAAPRDNRTAKGVRHSRRRGCKWKATLVQKVIRSDEIGGVDHKFWRFEQKPRAHIHNHPLAANAAEIPVNRRRAIEAAKDQIFALRGQPKATPQRIADHVNKHNPGYAITATDIKNLFYKETRLLRKQQREAERAAAAAG